MAGLAGRRCRFLAAQPGDAGGTGGLSSERIAEHNKCLVDLERILAEASAYHSTARSWLHKCEWRRWQQRLRRVRQWQRGQKPQRPPSRAPRPKQRCRKTLQQWREPSKLGRHSLRPRPSGRLPGQWNSLNASRRRWMKLSGVVANVLGRSRCREAGRAGRGASSSGRTAKGPVRGCREQFQNAGGVIHAYCHDCGEDHCCADGVGPSAVATLQEVSSRAKVMESFVPAAHVHAGQLKEEMKHQVHDLGIAWRASPINTRHGWTASRRRPSTPCARCALHRTAVTTQSARSWSALPRSTTGTSSPRVAGAQ